MKKYSKEQYGCPVSCRYCVITKVDKRRQMWNKQTVIGLNKAVTIFSPPPDKTDKQHMEEFYNFPLELFRGDIVGFNAISDPFWPKYKDELDYFLHKVSPIAKLVVCVTKFALKDETLIMLSKIPNFRLVVSITGLDDLENTKTQDRLSVLKRAKEYGVKAFPITHPYIAGMSNLDFLSELRKIDYDLIDVKGLRYNHETMSSWMPEESQKYYINTNEDEVLPEDGWREKVGVSGLKLKSLRIWLREEAGLIPKLSEQEAESNVKELLKYANITSSDSDQAVVEATINRRL